MCAHLFFLPSFNLHLEDNQVIWSGTGSLVAITAEDSFYILRFDREAYNAKLEEGAEITDEGVEEAFDVVTEIPEKSVLVALTPLLDC
jgi:coatomer subunit beta'